MIHAHWQLLWRNSIWQPSFLTWRKIGKLEIFLKSLERPILMTISIKKEIPLNFCPASTTYLYFCFFESFIPSMNQGKQSFLWRRPLNINGNATSTVYESLIKRVEWPGIKPLKSGQTHQIVSNFESPFQAVLINKLDIYVNSSARYPIRLTKSEGISGKSQTSSEKEAKNRVIST